MECSVKRTFRILIFFLVIITAITFSACTKSNAAGQDEKPYQYTYESGSAGKYGFDKAIITNLLTKEIAELVFDDVLRNKNWSWVLSFGFVANTDTEWTYNLHTESWFVINGGNAYELIADNTFRLHFPRWNGYDYNLYDVVIILGWHKVYG